jgi:rsbT co-antagonist protein RsbR
MTTTTESLQQENQRLRQQVTALSRERDLLLQQSQNSGSAIAPEQHPFFSGPVVLFKWVASEGWPVEYVSPNISQFGYSADDFLTGRVAYPTIVYPDDLERVAAEVAQYTAEGRPSFEQDYRVINGAGEVRWIYDYTTIIRDDTGTVTHYMGYILDITERKQMEEELQMFRTAVDHISDGVQWLNSEGRHLYVNRAMCEHLGYSRDELLQMSLDQVDPDVNIAQWRSELWPLIQERGAVSFEARHRRKDGSIFPVEVTGNYLSYAGQDYLFAFARDISERKQQEAELRMFQTLVENAPALISIANIDGRYQYFNPAFRERLGIAPDAAPQDFTIADMSPPEMSAELEQTLVPQILESGFWKGRSVFIDQSGNLFPGDLAVFVTRDAEGNPEQFIAIANDISDQIAADRELQQYAAIIEQTTDGISSSDVEGNVLMMNPAFRKMMGIPLDVEPSNYHAANLYSEQVVARMHKEVVPIAIRDGVWSGENTFLNQSTGEEIAVSQVLIAHRKADGSLDFVSTIVRDLREQKRAEAERMALQQQVIDAQRDALRELSTPLIPISNEVVIMPLIGTIDSGRAIQVMETLLEGVARHQANLVILDITGVSVVDTQVAQTFVQAAQAVRLLGAQVMLTGIQPQIAQTLVQLGVDLGDIITRGSLQAGIAVALRG